ncbi:hypothetical protein B0H19DRAFT_1386753 [Mycena capillaripes]|nr:hypothetical protein B0H19DRAFT_1386753 [Mycena capillaripes]
MAAGDNAKADQIVFHIYTKLLHILYATRASVQGPLQGKTDKWFNLETPLAAPGRTPIAEVLLVVPPQGGGTALVQKPSGTRIEPEPRYVVLEEWVLEFAPSAPSTLSSASDTNRDEEMDVLLPTIYKNAIPLLRVLLRILPARRVMRRPAGTITLSATYPTTPTFSLESLEVLLSSRFAVLDSRRDVPSASTDYAPNRTAGGARYQQQHPDRDDDDDDSNAEFVPPSPGAQSQRPPPPPRPWG